MRITQSRSRGHGEATLCTSAQTNTPGRWRRHALQDFQVTGAEARTIRAEMHAQTRMIGTQHHFRYGLLL